MHAGGMAEKDEVSGKPSGDATPPDPASPSAGSSDTDSPDDGRPVLPPDPDQAAAPTTQPVLKTRWRDRVWSFRAMLAVAAATLVIGGVAGGSIVALADDGHDHHGRFWTGPGDRVPPGWRDPRRFEDGGPRWHRDDGPQPPDGDVTPQPTPTPTPPPTQ
jgi:hypothetical protein